MTSLSGYSVNKELNQIISFGSIPLYISLLCNLGIIIGHPLQIDILVSICTRIMIVVVVGCAALKLLQQMSYGQSSRIIISFVLLFFIAVMLPVVNGVYVLLDRYVSILCFLMLPSYAVLYYERSNKRTTKNMIYAVNFLYWFVFLYLYRSGFSNIAYSEWGIFQYKELTLGFQNPNETGMMLLIPYIIMLCAFADAKKIWQRGLFAIPTFHLLYMIYCTGSRACIIIAFFILLLYLFRVLSKMSKLWVTIIFWLPLCVLLLEYIFPDIIGSILIMGDSADTGRGALWSTFISSTSLIKWIIGNIAVYGGSNLHNSYLSIVGMYGIVGLISYIVAMKKVYLIYLGRLNHNDNSQMIAFAGMLGVILHGCAEAAFLVSGAVYAGLVGLLFVLALPERKNL